MSYYEKDDEVYCGFCGKEMVEQEYAYISNYISIYSCGNHDVFYLIIIGGDYELFGKDGYEIVNSNGEGFLSRVGMGKFDKPEDVYGSEKGKIVLRTDPIDVDIYTFDKVVDKLKKLVPFA